MVIISGPLLLLSIYIQELSGSVVDDLSTPLGQAFDEWSKKARDLRNDIAHGKRIGKVDKGAAVASLISVKNFLVQLAPALHRP